MINKYIVTLILSISLSAQAEVIDAGRFTRDTATGLDWLDVTETRGLSYDEVEAQLAQGGAYQGWRFATVQELDQLITNFGYMAIGLWDCGYGLINCDDYYYIDPQITENQEIVEYMIRTLGDTASAYLEERTSECQVSPTGAGATSGFLAGFEVGAGEGMQPWGLIEDYELIGSQGSSFCADGNDIVMSYYIHRQDQANPDLGSFLVRPSEGAIPTSLAFIEAESMALSGGYAVEDNAAASGGQLIRRLDSGGYAATASTVFAGLAGAYDITVSYFDEYDGMSSLAFLLNDEMLDQWITDEDPVCRDCASPNERTLRSRVVARDVRLSPGDEITLQGTGEHYEYARFDKISLLPVGLDTLEAEDMILDDGYLVEANADASGGQIIRRLETGGYPAQASTVFAGAAGSYDIEVAYFDELDGQSSLAFLLNGAMLDQWIADEDPRCRDCASPNARTLRTRVVARGVRLSPGDEIALQGAGDYYEYARFDKIGFTPLQSPVIFDDGGVHTIDYPISAEEVQVHNGTTLNLLAGAHLNRLVSVYTSTAAAQNVVNVYDGEIGTIETAPGDICNIYGGAIRSVINGETIVIDGGRIDKLYSSWSGHYVTVSNGVIGEMEVHSIGGSLTISGGTFLGNVDIISEYTGWVVAISGGLFRGDINIDNIGVTLLTFYGDLKVDLVSETEGDSVYVADYFVEGTLRDGSPISTNLQYQTSTCCDWYPWTNITVEP